MTEQDPTSRNIDTRQREILDDFMGAYGRGRIVQDATSAAIYDQAVAEMREKVTDGFHLELADDKEFYDVMVGVAVASKQMERLVDEGLPIATASLVARVTLAGLRTE